MLVYYFFVILIWFVQQFLKPMTGFPDATMPADILSAISQASQAFHTLDQVFPVLTFLAVMVLYVSVEGKIFAYKLIKWLYNKIPGIN